MAGLPPYFDLIREMKNPYAYRLALVDYARQHGIKAAARVFQTTVLTVRKWLSRYQQHGPSGLIEQSRAPHRQPRQTPPQIEQRVVALRRQLPTFGARRLIGEFDLPLGHSALERIWRAHGLMKKRRKKYQRKQDLAAVKSSWRLFQQISAHTKDLVDIPRYWPQAHRLRLPWVQYTARQVRSGLQFLAYASRRSAGASAAFAHRIQMHLERCGIELKHLIWQTDNGSEFIGELQPDGSRSGFPSALGDSSHVRIPPAAHTYQSDVETVHRLIEDEFFDLETFHSRSDFLAKAALYQLYFNLARPNSHKQGLSPWQIIHHLEPCRPLRLCLLPPVFLDHQLDPQGGYLVPRHPYSVS
jgi:transposase